jgi:hypothetical protein
MAGWYSLHVVKKKNSLLLAVLLLMLHFGHSFNSVTIPTTYLLCSWKLRTQCGFFSVCMPVISVVAIGNFVQHRLKVCRYILEIFGNSLRKFKHMVAMLVHWGLLKSGPLGSFPLFPLHKETLLACIHTYTHTKYIHTYVHAHIRGLDTRINYTYMHTHKHTYIIRTYTH